MIDQELIKSTIRTIPDYPKSGILFRDITTLLQNGRAFNAVVEDVVEHWRNREIEKVVCLEARGFIFGGAIASSLKAGFIPVRKAGKLPHQTIGASYQLEYGVDRLEIHSDAIKAGDRVLIIDDLIATGGTADTAIKLVRELDGNIIGMSAIIDLPDLGGSTKIRNNGVEIYTLVDFPGH